MSYYQNLTIELIKAIPFLIIGLITAYIAYRQYKIEKSNLNKNLHQTRYRIYKAIEKIDYLLVVGEKIDTETLHEITFDINERHFVLSEKLNKEIGGFSIRIMGLCNKKAREEDKSPTIVNRYGNRDS